MANHWFFVEKDRNKELARGHFGICICFSFVMRTIFRECFGDFIFFYTFFLKKSCGTFAWHVDYFLPSSPYRRCVKRHRMYRHGLFIMVVSMLAPSGWRLVDDLLLCFFFSHGTENAYKSSCLWFIHFSSWSFDFFHLDFFYRSFMCFDFIPQ